MTLEDKAIDIKGKKYVLVSDRILAFNEAFPQGSITTELVSEPNSDMVVMKAIIKPKYDEARVFTGYSQATWGEGMVNKTAALENCETSAVGRALGFMGIGVIDSIASVDEINKAQTQPAPKFDRGANTSGLVKQCAIHNATMPPRISKVGNEYWAHQLPDKTLCFGK